MRKSLIEQPGFRFFLCLFVFGVLVGSLQFLPSDQVISVPKCETNTVHPMCLKEAGKEVIGLVKSLLELITSFDLAIIAAGGLLVMKRKDWITAWSGAESFFLVCLFFSAIASLGSIYLAYLALIGPVANGYAVPFGSQLEWALAIAFYGLMLSVVFLGAIVLKGLVDAPDAEASTG